MAQDRRERAGAAVQRGERVAHKWMDGWKGVSDEYFEMSQNLVAGRSTPMGLLADLWSLGLRACQAATGSGLMADQGLDFVVDAQAEAAGPRYVGLPAKADPTAIRLSAVAHADDAPKIATGKSNAVVRATSADGTTLDQGNVVVRVEDGQLAVSLVGLGERKPVREGTYHLTIDGIQGKTALSLNRKG